MKPFVILFIALIMISIKGFSQRAHDKCGTMEYHQKRIKSNPDLEQKTINYEAQIQQILSHTNLNKTNATITIPIVFHIIYYADSQNISDQRIFDQVAVTNRDFAGLNPHSMGVFASNLKANTGIQFCLARKKPNGTFTNGIERLKTTVPSFQDGDSVKFKALGGLDAWDPTKYLNVWVCNYAKVDAAGYIFSAYSQFPGGGVDETYGVVIRYGALGPYDSTYYRGNGGILNHELGHSLNLYHIWGDDGVSCSGSDYCGDTPNEAGRTTGKHTGLLTDNCSNTSPGIMYMNFMDYSDDIIYANFTPNQASRMQANFASPIGTLLSLANSDACSFPTGIVKSTKISDFTLIPNPAKAQVSISYTTDSKEEIEMTIYDIFGRVIHAEKLTSGLEENSFLIDLSKLSKGIYLVEISQYGQKGITKKLLIE